MAQGLLLAAQAIATALAADVALGAWASTHFGRPLTVIVGRAAGPASDDSNPVVSVDTADVGDEDQVLGYRSTEVTARFELLFAWKETNDAKAVLERLQLPDLVAAFAMRNKTLSGAVGAFVLRAGNDSLLEDGVFLWSFIAEASYQVKV